tara:strand:- start:1 stop:324 length:324 start_codon:yes stop_codon:yes gene_type:complete
MSAAAEMVVDNVRVSMHNVIEASFDQFYELGQSNLDTKDVVYAVGFNLHAKPDVWDRGRTMRTTLYFDNAGNLQDFLSDLKNQIDQLRSKLYASIDVRDDETSVDTL